jgi:RNA polymerase sigma-70 factor (ECF subfamily)
MRNKLDIESIRHLRNGEAHAWMFAVNNYNAYVNNYIFYLNKKHGGHLSLMDIQDITQEVFKKLWEKRETLDENKGIEAFLIKVTTNKTINFYKSRTNRKIRETEVYRRQDKISYNDLLDRKLIAESIQAGFDALGERHKDAFKMRYEQQFNNQKIAINLNIKIQSVKNIFTTKRPIVISKIIDSLKK